MRTTEVCISDIGKIITGNTPPRKNPELYGSHTIFIKPTDISDDVKYTRFPEECYSQKGYDKYLNSLIPKGATCVVTIGSIGKKMTKAHQDCFINQAMNAIVPFEHFDEEYVYYLLKHNLGMVKSLDSGTASGRENVSKSSFSKMRVKASLDKNIQTRIGKILSAYDDLIENNQKQIKLLEEAAMLLYKEWFVKLRFPGHENTKIVDGLPEGWMLTNVAGICTLVKNTLNANKIKGGIPYIGLEHMPRKDICLCEWGDSAEVNSNKFIFQKDDILFGKIRPYFHKVGFALIDGIASTDSIIMRANVDTWALLLMLISSEAFVNYTYQTCKEGAKMPRADWNTMQIYPTLVADSATMNSFESIIWDYTRKIKVLALQNRALCEARDKLLPKLMNGESEV